MFKKALSAGRSVRGGGALVTVDSFANQIEAELAREELTAAGIDASVGGGIVAQTLVPIPETGVTVAVRRRDARRARRIIERISQRAPISDEEINTASLAAGSEQTFPDGAEV